MSAGSCFRPFILSMMLVVAALAPGLVENSAIAQDGKVDFETAIKPIFENHCLKCHGEEDPEDFRIDDKDEAIGYVIEGEADASEMYEVLITEDEDHLMPPPDENNPLSAEQIGLVKRWIDEGAEWPEGAVFSLPPQAAGEASDESDPFEEEGAEGAEVPMANRIWKAVGPLHMAAVHLPIGLLLAAGLFALFSLRGNFVMSDCAYYCLWLGTFGAIAACVFGWSLGMHSPKWEWDGGFDSLTDMETKLFWHRTSALVVTALAFILALFAAGARNKDPDDGVMWKLGCIIIACAVGFTGHEGGELTHGKHLYDDLNEVTQDIYNQATSSKPLPEEETTEGDGEAGEGESSGDDGEAMEETETSADGSGDGDADLPDIGVSG